MIENCFSDIVFAWLMDGYIDELIIDSVVGLGWVGLVGWLVFIDEVS